MAKRGAAKSWADQFADLDDPTPRDFDPEDNAEHVGESTESEEEDLDGARSHYVDVDKSQLRKRDDTQKDLGAQYDGSMISRSALVEKDEDDDTSSSHSEEAESDEESYADPEEDLARIEVDRDEEIDSDEAFESGDEERFGTYKFRGSKVPSIDQHESDEPEEDLEEDHVDAEVEEFNGVHSDSEGSNESLSEDFHRNDTENSDENDSDDTSMNDSSPQSETNDRAALRKIMAEERQTVAASFSKTAKADITKGRAIKQQRTTFDTLLNTRIKLQKALIATNSLSATPTTPNPDTDTIQAAQTAALNLWNTLTTLRSSLQPQTTHKPSPAATPSTHSTTLWTSMQTLETPSLPTRRTTLTKWSQKTAAPTTLPRASKFSQTPPQQPLITLLDYHLTDPTLQKHIQKAHTPRSCAPLQATARKTRDPTIYDDADFYTLLLRELVDQRMTDSSTTSTGLPSSAAARTEIPLPTQRDLKIRKKVDTKASKGRKMRYTVHEKLVSFMAPEDRGTWGKRQAAELFGSLLGRKVGLEEGVEDGEGEGEGEEESDGMEGVEEGGGLKLFG